MRIGVAAEGTTDYAVIKSLLCGHFDNEDMDQDISLLQPNYDATDKDKYCTGSWTTLIKYLQTERFRDDISSMDYLIIQIDSDISNRLDFGVLELQGETKHEDLKVFDLIKSKLIKEIEAGKLNFHEEIKNKLIFCISIESIECWLNAYYNKKCDCKIIEKSCLNDLEKTFKNHPKFQWNVFKKKQSHYKDISDPFYDRENVEKTKNINLSLNIFLDDANKILL